MKLRLSKRMEEIVSLCEKVDTIVDVGCDHGKVAIGVANLNLSNSVIAIDNKIGPLNACIKNAEKYLISPHAEFKTILGSGIEKVDKKVESGIIITGIGYDNMIDILSNINDYNYKYLILSPHTKITELIKYLDKVNIDITENKNVFEDEKYYYIIKGVHK